MIPCLCKVEAYLSTLKGRTSLSILEEILAETNVVVEELKEVAHFHDKHYQRNHLSGSEWYDLYVMCWRPGQESPIHDHAGSNCALKIITGRATETGYAPQQGSPFVKEGIKRHYFPGSLCLAHDGEIHKITNDSPSDDLITLHIYSPPLKMNTYEVDTGSMKSDREISR